MSGGGEGSTLLEGGAVQRHASCGGLDNDTLDGGADEDLVTYEDSDNGGGDARDRRRHGERRR